MPRGYSDGYLQNLWRRAVRVQWDGRCARCGRPGGECHHIVRRSRAALRNDWRNGIVLCSTCHAWAHTLEGRRWVEEQVDLDYLTAHDVILTDHLTRLGLTRAEFDRRIAQDLKAKIEEGR